jgi:hypothetical protein
MKKIAAAVQSTVNTKVASANERLTQARAEFEARKQAKAAAPTAQPAADESVPFTAEQQETMAAAENLFSTLKLPSMSRLICGVIFGIALAAGFGILMGYVVSALMIGAMAMTGSAFIANCIYVLGMIYAFIKGAKISVRGAAYIISGNVDKTFGGVTSTVGSWFKRQPQVIQVVSSGAWQHGAA